ncbi:MAG: ACT domain-containing protein [Polyangiaceae bacterium]|nr:ACT domain-containing protein [Polyangiaceae bacterium]
MPDRKLELAELRKRLQALDRDLLRVLEERGRASREICRLLEGEPVSLDPAERAHLDAIAAESTGVLPAAGLRSIFREVLAVARGIEQPARVAYLGPEGGFCHAVAERQFGAGTVFVECATVGAALEEVERGRALFAVFPFESSVDGLVQTSINALEQSSLSLIAERSMPATYDLVGHATVLSEVRKLYATALAHASCERFVARELGQVTIVDVRSPVAAAELARTDVSGAALVPESCGQAAELSVVRANVGDAADTHFRYGIAGARPASRSGDDTTCVLFSVDDAPGALYEVLRHFAERGINLKKLQSRPVNAASWDYVFYVEVSGHISDRSVVTALESVKRATKYLRPLGSFPNPP